MSVNSEKYAVQALLQAVLILLIPTASENVFLDVLDEPYLGTYPAIVLRRERHRTVDLYSAGGPVRGNDPNAPNVYRFEYYDQLVSESGSTLQETMDAHDDYLEALNAALAHVETRYLPDEHNQRQVEDCGATIDAVSNIDGPYVIKSGNPSILSSAVITVQQLYRYAV